MPRKPGPALRTLRRTASETSSYLKSLSQTSENLTQKSSEVLIGTFGGVVGGIVGYALDFTLQLALPGIPITMGGAAGLVGTMLLWRGPKRLLLERQRRADERELMHRIDYSNNLQAKLGPTAPLQLIEAARNYPLTGVMEATNLTAPQNIEEPKLEGPVSD